VPTVILPIVFPAGNTSGPSTVTLPSAVNPNIRIPYSMQYNVTIEHQRGNNSFRISYVGTNTRHGVYAFNINQPLPSTVPYINKPRLFPLYPNFNYLTNGAGHQYNGLTEEVKRRVAKGITFQLSYTLAKDIGDLERGQAPENAYDRRRERGTWVDIPKHSVTGNMVYDLPFGKNRHYLSNSNWFVNGVLGNWSVSVIHTYRSGRNLSPAWTGTDPANTAFTTGAPANVTIRPNATGISPNLSDEQRSVSRWFNPAAFAAPTPGQFGTSGNGVIRGPTMHVWDAGLFKEFKFRERLTVHIEATATNLRNHPNYNDPTTNISQAGNVGVISGVGGLSNVSGASSPLDPAGPRQFRTGIRLEF
jgi:hypothetical protein